MMSSETVKIRMGTKDVELDAEGYYTAKAVAAYELGDSSYADTILGAYFDSGDPENDEAREAWGEIHGD
jgi:hypothetical protein